ncbi:hypothetical protein CLOP_g10203 [Closterium sp. NIES-67]|nr:hypothetical protein CLOP_g10203 [Closterium sp. NIES-67]
MLVYGSLLHCLSPLLSVAAAASLSRDPFLAPITNRNAADAARRAFAAGSAAGSDHLAVVMAHEGWMKANMEGRAMGYCDENFLAPSGMRLMLGLKLQIERMLWGLGWPAWGSPLMLTCRLKRLRGLRWGMGRSLKMEEVGGRDGLAVVVVAMVPAVLVLVLVLVLALVVAWCWRWRISACW